VTTVGDDRHVDESGGVAEPTHHIAATRAAARLRQHQILSMARERGALNVSDASRELNVSVETIRRDLTLLEGQGLLRRAYGNAYPVESVGFETDLQYRSESMVAEKSRIAAFAVEQLQDAESVFIDEGHLPHVIARSLPADRRLTVVTASLSVAADLAVRPPYTVIMLGGRVRGRTLATVDHWVASMIAEFSVDLAFMGANGLSIANGATTPDPAVSAVKAAAMHTSRRRIFVGTHNKFGVSSFSKFADVSAFEMLITDTGLSLRTAHSFAMAGPEVERV
jgi:DeoR/GlpR family transcriptional regulator of sugar metabolism